MRISGRLALHNDGAQSPFSIPTDGQGMIGFHGRDIVLDCLSQTRFEAEWALEIASGTLVRLRLPGSGVMIARVMHADGKRLAAEFVNPVGAYRLGKTIGIGQQSLAAVA